MDRVPELLCHICELLDCMLAELKCITTRLREEDNYSTMEIIGRRREQSLANYKLAYERQHAVSGEGEDEID